MKKKLFSEIPHLVGNRIELRKLEPADAEALKELTEDPKVYRYEPTFLFERKYDDMLTVIERLYDECWEESIILGIFLREEKQSADPAFCGDTASSFCGLAEMYGFRDNLHKVSVGYRLVQRCWGRGIATETLKLMVDYLCNETDIEIITASTMIENQTSANVLKKNGFTLVVHAVDEDWGYPVPTVTDKWIR